MLYFFQAHYEATLEFANVCAYPITDIISNVADTWEEIRLVFTALLVDRRTSCVVLQRRWRVLPFSVGNVGSCGGIFRMAVNGCA